MMSQLNEQQLREQLVHYGRSLFMRGFSSGGSGNLSVRLPDGGYLGHADQLLSGRAGRRNAQ